MATPSASAVEKRLVDFVAGFTKDPLGYSRAAFQWGVGELEGSAGPREWQSGVLLDIKTHLSNPETRFQPLLIAVASGHDIGKTGLISMIAQWAMSTCPDTKIVVTANTDTQLKTKTMPEMAKWFRLAINSHWFKTTATAVYANDPSRERTWRVDAIPWSEESTEAFAGLHNKGRRIVLIFDESSAISDKIWEVAEGALVDENTEIIWIAFGNPTRNTGRFRACFSRFKHRWITRQIDSRTVEGTNKTQLQKFVEDYGEDSDFVRIRVKGEFPRAGVKQFIPGDIVELATQREQTATLMDPLVLGVDIARSLEEDETVMAPRRGRDARSIPWVKMRTRDTMEIADEIIKLENTHHFDAIFIDGGGVGGGVIDFLRRLGYNIIEVQFGASADKSVTTGEGPVAYANKRAEMWGAMRDWLKGGAIPDDPELVSDLISVSYGDGTQNKRDVVILESKKDMKSRGLASPDRGDALCVTFAFPVVPKDHSHEFGPQVGRGDNRMQIDYDPFARERVVPTGKKNEYDSLSKKTYYGAHG